MDNPIVSVDTKILDSFHVLFAGHDLIYGQYNITGQLDSGKLTGIAKTNKIVNGDSEWPALWKQHLNGAQSLGVIPIRSDNACMFGAIDIDVYDGLDHQAIAAMLAKTDAPALPCLSKSGGCHVYVWARDLVPAALMQARLAELAAVLGHPDAEVFPKQATCTESGGNWISMPFFGETRPAIMPNGQPYAVAEFLTAAEALRAGPEWFATSLRGNPRRERKARKSAFLLPDQIGEGRRDATLTSFAGSMRRNGAGPEAILAALREVNKERCDPPMSDSDLERIARSVSRYEPKEDGGDAGLTKELADAITFKDFFARDAGGLLYHFDGGVYKPTGERFVERNVKELCQGLGRTKQWSPELATRVAQWILVDAPEIWERPPLDVLNVRNGLLDVGTRTLRPHSPDHLSPVQIAASFDPAAKCPHIDRFIKDVFPDDTQHLPFEIAAWLMLPDTSVQKAILLLGEGANGKSVWMDLLSTWLGRENVSTLNLHRIEADKFAAARLVGKLCNIGTDLPTAALAGTSMLKALTGGDTVTAERKYQSSFEFRPFVRLLFSANIAPRSDDATHGFFRRWLVIPFNRTFDETDPNTVPRAVLDARLSQPGELSGMLNRALDALPVIQQGRFTESASTRAALDEFRRTTDPLAVWMESNTVERPDAFVAKDKLRAEYAQVCMDSGRPILPDTQFTAALKRLRPKVSTAQRRIDTRVVRVFVGIGLMTRDPEPGSLVF